MLVSAALSQTPGTNTKTMTPPAGGKVKQALAQVSAQQIARTDKKLVGFETRLTVSTNFAPESKRGVLAARDWIRGELERYSQACGGCLDVKVQTFTEQPGARIPQPTNISNVYAILRGTDPDAAKRMLIMTAHYDSIVMERMTDPEAPAPGANDDASGTAAVLEAARVLSRSKFPATIVFALFAGEEQGLNGSRAFAAMARQENWNIEAVLNNDIIGGDRSPGQNAAVVRVFSEGIPITTVAEKSAVQELRLLGLESDSPSRQLARYVAATARAYAAPGVAQAKMVFRQDRYLRGGDHTSFNQQGFAAVRFTEFRENYAHQHQVVRTENGIEYGDLPKFVDFDYVARVTRLNVAALATLASAPAPPSQVRIDTKKLENDTTLSWEPSAGASSYAVVWRDTTAADWEHSRNVGVRTSVTIPVSKDNVVFGVRAIGRGGEPSLVSVPAREQRQ